MRRLLIELRAALGAFGTGRLLATVAVWVLMVGAALFGAFHSCCARRTFVLVTPAISMGAFFAAFTLGGSLQLMLADLRRLCAPGSWLVHAGGAVGAMLLMTVIIPAAALSLLQGSAEPAEILAVAVLCGLLLARAARFVGVIVIVLAFLTFAARGPIDRLAAYFPVLGGAHVPMWLDLVILAALVGWLWRPVLAGDMATLESAARRVASWRTGWSLSEGSSRWFPAASPQSWPGQPMRIVRACLGPMYLSRGRAALRMGAQGGFAILLVQLQFLWFRGWQHYWEMGVLIGVLTVWVMFAGEVSKALGRSGGQLAELASLPGLGGPRSQLWALWRASSTRPLLITVVVGALALVAAHTADARPSASVRSSEWLATSLLFGLACMASVLAGRAKAWPEWIVLACLAAALVVWVLREAGPHPPGNLEFIWPWSSRRFGVPVWPVLPLVATLVLIVNARRVEALPHPFVVRA